MNKYLSTDELIKRMNQSKSSVHQKKKAEPKKVKPEHVLLRNKKIKKIIYFALLALAIVHVIFMTIPLISPSSAVNITGRQYVMAVPNNQPLDTDLHTRIVRIKTFRINDVNIGDQVVIYGKFGTNVFWMEEIVEIDYGNQTIMASFDGFLRNTYLYEEVHGTVVRETSLMGTFFYVSTQPRGYIALLVTFIVIFGTVYYFFIKEQKTYTLKTKK